MKQVLYNFRKELHYCHIYKCVNDVTLCKSYVTYMYFMRLNFAQHRFWERENKSKVPASKIITQ